MKKMNRRIIQDRSGISGWGIIAIIIFLLAGWEIIGGYYGMGFSDYFGTAEKDVTVTMYLEDKIDYDRHYIINSSLGYIQYEQGHLYQLVVKTNAPYKLSNPYKYNIAGYWASPIESPLVNTSDSERQDIDNYADPFMLESINIGSNALWSNTFTTDIPVIYLEPTFVFGDDQYNLLKFEFVGSSGNILKSGNLFMAIDGDDW
jgi:hypothetical protein